MSDVRSDPMKTAGRNKSNLAPECSQPSAEDFILQQHNAGEPVRKEEIARQYAQRYCGRSEATQQDLQFVDRILTNHEG
jgi:hypothetical protein